MSQQSLKNKRIPLIWVFCPMFVVIMIGYLWISQINNEINGLKVTASELSVSKTMLERERDAMLLEIKQANTDEYIVSKARQLYGYMMPNELLFIIKNPEALQSNDEVPQMYVLEGDQL